MGKIALVTGGNSGIGYATAKLLKERQYTVFISGRNPDKMKQAADELEVEPIIADMAKPDDIKSLASQIGGDGLDVLVNNAGIRTYEPIDEFTPKNFENSFNTNVRGPLLMIQALLPALEKRKGSITNVSSIVVTKGLSNGCLYAATKGAIDAVTRSLALELAPRGIRVNAVSPGATDTPINYRHRTKEEFLPLKKKFEMLVPLKRFGDSSEVAEVIISQLESAYTTGSVWAVDGGFSCS